MPFHLDAKEDADKQIISHSESLAHRMTNRLALIVRVVKG